MGIRKYKPTTAGPPRRLGQRLRRHHRPQEEAGKVAARAAKKKGGRNNQGVITSRFRGGGHKQMYRIIDFKRRKDGVWATVVVDRVRPQPLRPHRAARSTRTARRPTSSRPKGSRPATSVISGDDAEPRVGNCLPLRKIPLGMSVHNVEMQPGRGGQICRSAGCQATLTAREGDWAQITLPSGEVRRVCQRVPGDDRRDRQRRPHEHQPGQGRPQALDMGRKPHNRGTSMNPVSHPMGGGEGRTAGGRHPCSPTGVLAKGGKTRKKRKPSNSAIIRRRRPGPHYAARVSRERRAGPLDDEWPALL